MLSCGEVWGAFLQPTQLMHDHTNFSTTAPARRSDHPKRPLQQAMTNGAAHGTLPSSGFRQDLSPVRRADGWRWDRRDACPALRVRAASHLAARRVVLLTLMVVAGVGWVGAWDYEPHRIINQAALAGLPTNFPAFVRSADAIERIAFLSGEPDRWRNTPDLVLKHVNHPDHYMDLEELDHYGLKDQDLPVFRYDFVARLALARQQRPDVFPAPAPEDNQDHTKELVGLLPWKLTEEYGRLKSGFSYLRALEQHGGSVGEIENARANIIHVMGVMGHFAGDAAQPLHTTIHFNGWVGDNPEAYTTNRGIHALIDGGYFARTGLPDADSLALKMGTASGLAGAGSRSDAEAVFREVLKFIRAQQERVEPLYRLEKQGVFAPGADPAKGRAFLEEQMALGARLLADLWVSAWRDAPEDAWLIRKLGERKASGPASP
jgi:hypothetical protein